MKKLVDGEKLKQWVEKNKFCMPFKSPGISPATGSYIEVIRVDKFSDFQSEPDFFLSPAELARENFKALARWEELKKKLKQWMSDADQLLCPVDDIAGIEEVLDEIQKIESQYNLNPASIPKGKAWVLEELKVKLKDGLETLVTGERSTLFVYYKNALNDTLADIRDLESQAPISELEQEIEKNRRKAEKYDEMERLQKESIKKIREIQEQLDKDIKITKKDLDREFSDLLSQSKKPPKAEEESDERR